MPAAAIFPSSPQPKTISFRRFREKHIELSEIYWQHVIGAQAIEKALGLAAKTDLAVTALGIATQQDQWGFTVQDTLAGTARYIDRVRLHLLAICCANLESFLKDACFCHIMSRGFKNAPGELSESGEALGSPILKRSSLPDPMKYAEHLFSVNYDSHIAKLTKAYAYRCALVHNGGVVLPRTIQELSLPPSSLHTRLGYSWADLKSAMESAFEVAKITDRKLSTYTFRLEEIERELCFLRDTKTLPKKEVWKYFHDQGFSLPRKRDREKLLNAVKQRKC